MRKQLLEKYCIAIVALLSITQTSVAQSFFMSNGSTTTCTGNFYDSGGPGAAAANKYAVNENYVYTICPSTPGQFVWINFTAFRTQNPDKLIIYDGNSTAAPVLITLFGAGVTTPVTYKATASNATGCLTFAFTSDNTAGNATNSAGWEATISCGAAGTAPTPTNQDCIYKQKICATTAFSDNGKGKGTVNDLNATNRGCLSSGEQQATWYYFVVASAGAVVFKVKSDASGDDYDFAIWGPNPNCPPTTGPMRCTYCAGSSLTDDTGLKTSESDNWEDALQEDNGITPCNWFVKSINVLVGETYIVYIDNFSASGDGFTIDFTGTTAGLDCSNLGGMPVDLAYFIAKPDKSANTLLWKTLSEENNDHFEIERSIGNGEFSVIASIKGAGNSTIAHQYSFVDNIQTNGIVYYRLKQVDFDQEVKFFNIVAVNRKLATENYVTEVYNNPVDAADGSIKFGYNALQEGVIEVSLENIVGQTIVRKQISVSSGTQDIQLSLGQTLLPNVYFIQVKTPDGVDIKRVVVR